MQGKYPHCGTGCIHAETQVTPVLVSEDENLPAIGEGQEPEQSQGQKK
jgi:hypothetical protein